MDEDTRVLWPERWTYYGLMVRREEDSISFSSELQNEPINSRDCFFNIEEFHYWDKTYASMEDLLQRLGPHLVFYGACDPSLGRDTARGDYTAIIVLARDVRTNALYVLTADIARRPPDQTVEAVFAYFQRFPFALFAVEANQFQELLVREILRRGREMGQLIPLLPLTNTSDKSKRIQGLQPWLKGGAVFFSRSQHRLLEQLRYFPRGKCDDGPDALEMAVRAAQHMPQEEEEQVFFDHRTGEFTDEPPPGIEIGEEL